MEQKTKNGLIAVGSTLGTLIVLYFILRKKDPINNITYYQPLPSGQNTFDPYNLVERTDKIQAVKDYLKKETNYDANSQLNINMQKLALSQGRVWEPYWVNADYEAKTAGLNSWFEAIQKNQPKFTWNRGKLLTDYYVDTKTGQRLAK
jgi:hypothetical protein